MDPSMKSLKNHLSLIIALFTILFTIQTLVIVQRSLDAYENKLKNDYSIVLVASKKVDINTFLENHSKIQTITAIDPTEILTRLKQEFKQEHTALLKLSLPFFYRITLKRFPSILELEQLKNELLKEPYTVKIESFSASHNKLFLLLKLVKNILIILSATIFIVTTLLIMKEMRIWQFQHFERMSIMALFGAPIWLRSAVLFRFAIVDAIIAAFSVIVLFSIISSLGVLDLSLKEIGIHVELFNLYPDALILTLAALFLSIFLAVVIMVAHKEEI